MDLFARLDLFQSVNCVISRPLVKRLLDDLDGMHPRLELKNALCSEPCGERRNQSQILTELANDRFASRFAGQRYRIYDLFEP